MREKNEEISDRVVQRLTEYLTILIDIKKYEEFVNSIELAKIMNTTSAQVRKDLSTFGEFGIRGKGYDVANLIIVIESILGINTSNKVIVVGHGKMGEMITSNNAVLGKGFKIVGVFDKNKDKIGSKVPNLNVEIKDIENIGKEMKSLKVTMAILSVIKNNAQVVADILIANGITAILNMTTYKLEVPLNITVINMDISAKLQELNFWRKYLND